jgi:hypothetical protein
MRRGRAGATHYLMATLVTLYLCSVGVVSASRQAPPEPGPEISENVFKDVQVLKGLPVDEFLDAMGMFANALGYDCVSCHSPEIANVSTFDAFAIPTPKIQRARQMVVMMNTINRTYFGGEQRVTCFTCHTSDNKPDVAASLDLQYGPLVDDPYEIEFFPAFFAPSPDEIFAAYAEALGGPDRLAALTSYVATGTYAGYDTGQEDVPMEILAKAPNKRSIVAQGPQGLSVWKTDGVGAWKMQPSTPLPVVPMTGRCAGRRDDVVSQRNPAGVHGVAGGLCRPRRPRSQRRLRDKGGRDTDCLVLRGVWSPQPAHSLEHHRRGPCADSARLHGLSRGGRRWRADALRLEDYVDGRRGQDRAH